MANIGAKPKSPTKRCLYQSDSCFKIALVVVSTFLIGAVLVVAANILYR
jgi:hypothetical protein